LRPRTTGQDGGTVSAGEGSLRRSLPNSDQEPDSSAARAASRRSGPVRILGLGRFEGKHARNQAPPHRSGAEGAQPCARCFHAPGGKRWRRPGLGQRPASTGLPGVPAGPLPLPGVGQDLYPILRANHKGALAPAFAASTSTLQKLMQEQSLGTPCFAVTVAGHAGRRGCHESRPASKPASPVVWRK